MTLDEYHERQTLALNQVWFACDRGIYKLELEIWKGDEPGEGEPLIVIFKSEDNNYPRADKEAWARAHGIFQSLYSVGQPFITTIYRYRTESVETKERYEWVPPKEREESP